MKPWRPPLAHFAQALRAPWRNAGAGLSCGAAVPDYGIARKTRDPSIRATRLYRQKQRERLIGGALEVLAIALVAGVLGADAAELDVGLAVERHIGDGGGDRDQLGAAPGAQRGDDPVHLAIDGRAGDQHQPILALPV